MAVKTKTKARPTRKPVKAPAGGRRAMPAKVRQGRKTGMAGC